MFLGACFQRTALPLSHQRSLNLADPASCHISEAAVLLWIEITECWWAEDDLNWLLGKQRPQFAKGGLLDCCLSTFILFLNKKKNCTGLWHCGNPWESWSGSEVVSQLRVIHHLLSNICYKVKRNSIQTAQPLLIFIYIHSLIFTEMWNLRI